MTERATIPILSEGDVVSARQQGRAIASELGFSPGEQALIATAISEMARNIVQYAGRGEVVVEALRQSSKPGILVVARDEGPGIPNLELAMQDGYSTGGGLGLGLPGCKRIMDELEIASAPGKGTTVTMRKWRA